MTYGRYTVIRPDGRVFVVEPILTDYNEDGWMYMFDPNEVNGSYLAEERGMGCWEKDSIITEENGFKNIVTLAPGESPNSWIDKQ